MNTGSKWYQEFVAECKDDPKRFEKPIKRNKIKNFTDDAIKTKVSYKDKNMKEIKCKRDIFGKLLFIAGTKKLEFGQGFVISTNSSSLIIVILMKQ